MLARQTPMPSGAWVAPAHPVAEKVPASRPRTRVFDNSLAQQYSSCRRKRSLFFVYSDQALAWIEQRSLGTGRLVRRLERWFERAGLLILFAAPTGVACLLAGALRVNPVAFVVIEVLGTIAGITLIWLLGERFAEPIDSVMEFDPGERRRADRVVCRCRSALAAAAARTRREIMRVSLARP